MTRGKFTGKTRHRVQRIGLFCKREVLVLQYELEGYVYEYHGGHVGSTFERWWIDARPEWLMEESKNPQTT